MSYFGGMDLTPEQEHIAQTYLLLSPTDEWSRRVDQDQQRLDALREWETTRRESVRQSLEYQRKQLRLAQERDALQATRPDGCWCLGVGGQNPWTERVGEQKWHFFQKHCSCPEGQKQRARDREQHNAYYNALHAQRAEAFRQKLPARFLRLTLDSYPTTTPEQQAVIDQIKYWHEGQWQENHDESEIRQWLLLHGPYGTGKTGLAGALGAELLRSGFVETVHMAAVPRLLDRVRATYNRQQRDDETEADVMEELFDVECLILDDLGAERNTDWATEKLFTLINHRHDEELTTIMTSNLTPSELGEHIGERTMWRIAELAQVVSLEGCPNLRLPRSRRGRPDDTAEGDDVPQSNVVNLKRGTAATAQREAAV